jgi:hypothetical protein
MKSCRCSSCVFVRRFILVKSRSHLINRYNSKFCFFFESFLTEIPSNKSFKVVGLVTVISNFSISSSLVSRSSSSLYIYKRVQITNGSSKIMRNYRQTSNCLFCLVRLFVRIAILFSRFCLLK